MMMSLDMFLFEIGTLPYQEMRQSWEWRFAESERFGARPATQFVGIGAEPITLTGALYPGQVGSYSSIAQIREMGESGESYTLVSGLGEVMGEFTIRKFDLSSEIFFVDGVARKASFTLDLVRAS